MKKSLLLATLGLVAGGADATVLVDIQGLGRTGITWSGGAWQSGYMIGSADNIVINYPDPTQTMLSQIDAQGLGDGDSAIFSQPFVAPTTDTVTHIQWNGSGSVGSAGLGFIFGIWDKSVPVTKNKGLPGFGAGGSGYGGQNIALLDLPINQIAKSPAANGMTHYDATIPALPLVAGHSYFIAISAVSNGVWAPRDWSWELAVDCSVNVNKPAACTIPFGSGLMASAGGFATYSLVAFQLTNDAVAAAVQPVPPVINTTVLPDATIGSAYTANISTTVPDGDNATVTVTGLPSGLSFDATTNTISGSVNITGNFSINITVADATTNLSTSSVLSLTVNDNPLVFAPANLPDATTNSAYNATFTAATGGYGSFTYTATGLPTGLSITGNTISGTPIVAGLYNVTLSATDSVQVRAVVPVTLNVVDPVAATPTACSGTNAVITAYVPRNPGYITVNGGLNLLDHLWTNNLNAGNTTFNGGLINWYSTGAIVNWTGTIDPNGCILDHLTVSPRVTINTTALPVGAVGTAYSAPVAVTWGVAPYTTSVIGLPAGLSFDGVNITGTPSIAGTFTVSISTIDSLGVSAASAPLTLTVNTPPPPVLSTPTIVLPATGTVGVAYSGSAKANGGVAPFTWTASGLPTGVSISTAGVISGTPTAAGTFASPNITVTDAVQQTAAVTGNNVIISAAPPATGITCTAPAGAKTGLNTSGKITSIVGNVITISKTNKTTGVVTVTTITVPACATIKWNGGATAFAIGQALEWKGYSSTATGNVAQSVIIG